jgi:hypothetical protein
MESGFGRINWIESKASAQPSATYNSADFRHATPSSRRPPEGGPCAANACANSYFVPNFSAQPFGRVRIMKVS